MAFYSPLRYPGGKARVANYIKRIFEENSLRGGIYVEPYAGGASVALTLLFDGYASKIIINDKDRSIFAFWNSVLNETDKLCELIEKTPVDLETWRAQKEIQKEKKDCDLLELGFSTFFLNRTNFSGIIKAGVIGGQKQEGEWKIDARYNKEDLILKIKKIASCNHQIEVHNLDTIELIDLLKGELPKKTLFFFDPPYHIKGKDLYLNYYNDENHKEVERALGKIVKQKWILTYDNVDFISNLYEDYRRLDYSLSYSVLEARKGKELMIFSDNIKISETPIVSCSRVIGA